MGKDRYLGDGLARRLRKNGDLQEDLREAGIAALLVDGRNRVVERTGRQTPDWPLSNGDWRTFNVRCGAYQLVLGVPWLKTQQELRERTGLLAGLSFFVVLAGAGGAWVLVGRTLSPIDHLARQAGAASVDSLRVQLQVPSPDAEISRLVATLNGLLARLGETAAMRGRFYAAASHELRTPLQALTGHLELALRRPRDAAGYQIALGEAHVQAERLTSLVQDLLFLNQLETGISRPPDVQLDLADLCASELMPLSPLAARRGVEVQLHLPATCEMCAPWNHVTMIVRNLIENAVKYATPGSQIQIQLASTTLTISNDCFPIGNGEVNQLFEPFFRSDASRSSETGGNGLGLAICKAIADSNGWKLNLNSQRGKVCAVVCFNSWMAVNPESNQKSPPTVYGLDT